ncbi:MAG TPA: hypothetical protein VNK95_17770, partial [Caldilineaceae bacterium]|nr:hypothetical protein [Caldilineaceae bacterium]
MGLDSLLDSSLQRLRARVALPAWRALPVGRALPAWMLLPLLAIPALWPLYREGLPRTIDGGLHLLRISLLDDYIRAGMFYPRWVSEMQLGHGYPLFSFYAPGFYYLTILLQRLGLSDYQAFIAASCLLVVLAGIGMERLARDSFAGAPGQRAGALLAAIAYMYAPFLFSNIYTSGALPAAAGQALLPWTLWSYRRLLYAKRPANYVLPGALFLAAVAITHNLTLVFLAPVLLVYTLVCWRQAGAGWGRLLWLAATLGLAAGVSAFFWLPVLIEQRYLTETGRLISTTQWLPRNFWRWDNFLDLGFFYPYSYNRPVKLGLVQLGLAALGWLAAKRRDPEWMTLLGLAVGLSLFMGEWAMPIWLATPILALTQFPWRLLAITSLLLALMAGGLLLHLRPTILRTATLAVAALT